MNGFLNDDGHLGLGFMMDPSMARTENITSIGFCPERGCSEVKPLILLNDFICGNGIIEGSEECDDGNLDDNDGCSRFCQVEECYFEPEKCAVCGNEIRDYGEECDLGAVNGERACDDKCRI